ncbi:MAG: hypothetical protein MJ252_07425 [archaeon]|nr:hypothetical protein [archaeon]
MSKGDIKDRISEYLKENNYEIIDGLGKIEPIQEIRAAYLKKKDANRGKDFFFDFSEDNIYYFFLTKSLNPNYLEPIKSSSGAFPFRARETSESPISFNMNIDYNKYVITLHLINKEENKTSSPLKVWLKVPLNREVCTVNHTTKEAIQYYKMTKTIKPEAAKKNLEEFILMLEKYNMIEIETKKPLNETSSKEDGVQSVIYLITPDKEQIVDLFTVVKYSIYFIKETLINYIGKYIRDIIHSMTHLPSEILTDFLSHLGIIQKCSGSSDDFNIFPANPSNASINNSIEYPSPAPDRSSTLGTLPNIEDEAKFIFPLKKYLISLSYLSYKNLIYQTYRDFPNIIRPKAKDRVPFHKFIQIIEKYNIFYAENEFKIKTKDRKKKEFAFLEDSVIPSLGHDKIKEKQKINLKLTLHTLFKILSDFLLKSMNENKETAKIFLLQSISKYVLQYATSNGFFNLDVVMNEDSMFEFQCCKNKKTNKWFNTKLFGCLSSVLKGLNLLFELNEGFFHKHFSILDYSYNFNEKNVIHTFPCFFDSSKKNKVRIFDIPFLDKWSYYIATIILFIYIEYFGLFNEGVIEKLKDETIKLKLRTVFNELFDEALSVITKEFFESYEKVLPDYYSFCNKISRFPLDKYNCLDNVCQHFTNNSIQILIKKNIIFFSPYDILYPIDTRQFINYPNIDIILEPYLILVDRKLKNYLDSKENREGFLNEGRMTIQSYFNILKSINKEKVHYSVFKSKYTVLNFKDEFGGKIYEKKCGKISPLQVPGNSYDFFFLNNLSYFYIYKTMQDMKGSFINYDILKRYIASIESSVTISFNDYDKSILQTTQKDIKTVKQTKKDLKKNIIKDLMIMKNIRNMNRRMTFIFLGYVKGIANDIIDSTKNNMEINKEESIKDNCYIKIGHYLVNIALYDWCEENNLNNIPAFIKSEFYQKLNRDLNEVNVPGKNEGIEGNSINAPSEKKKDLLIEE